jgi:5'-deoxynucleotidase YfbR-like HD superfamily hydrolase
MIYSGSAIVKDKIITLENLTEDDIHIEDIAFALSNLARFCGQRTFYSVANHSLLVASLLPDNLKLSGLLHDATEAYVGDVISPIKAHLPFYVNLEKSIMQLVINKYKIDPYNPKIKQADKDAFGIEDYYLKREFRSENQKTVYEAFLTAFNVYKDMQ